MSVKKTYTMLSQLPSHVISKCSAVLANGMQCWRAGDVLCEVEHELKEGEEVVKKVTSHQYCRAHALIEQAKDEIESNLTKEETAKAQQEAKPEPVAPKPVAGTAQIKK